MQGGADSLALPLPLAPSQCLSVAPPPPSAAPEGLAVAPPLDPAKSDADPEPRPERQSQSQPQRQCVAGGHDRAQLNGVSEREPFLEHVERRQSRDEGGDDRLPDHNHHPTKAGHGHPARTDDVARFWTPRVFVLVVIALHHEARVRAPNDAVNPQVPAPPLPLRYAIGNDLSNAVGRLPAGDDEI